MINKTFYLTVILLFLAVFTTFAQTDTAKPQIILCGNELDPSITSTKLTDLSDKDINKTIQIEGKVSEVCQDMGCWMFITDGNITVRVLTKHKFFMPKDCAGSYATVQGVFKIKEVSPEEQMHYLEESGKTPDKPITESIKELRIEATGVKLTK